LSTIRTTCSSRAIGRRPAVSVFRCSDENCSHRSGWSAPQRPRYTDPPAALRFNLRRAERQNCTLNHRSRSGLYARAACRAPALDAVRRATRPHLREHPRPAKSLSLTREDRDRGHAGRSERGPHGLARFGRPLLRRRRRRKLVVVISPAECRKLPCPASRTSSCTTGPQAPLVAIGDPGLVCSIDTERSRHETVETECGAHTIAGIRRTLAVRLLSRHCGTRVEERADPDARRLIAAQAARAFAYGLARC